MPSQSRSKPGGKGRGKPGKALSKNGKKSLQLERRGRERTTKLEIQNREPRNPIDEGKRSGETRQESRERYRALVETSPDAVFVHRDGRFIYANPGALRMYGAASFEELEGRSVLDLIHPDDRGKIEARIKQVAEGRAVPLQETRVIRLDGQQVFIEAAAAPVNYQGAPAVQAIARDITNRKHTEAAILRAKKEWERTFDAVPDLVAIVDNQYRIVRINKAMAERFGLTPDQCIGKACYKMMHGLDSPPDFCPHTLTLTDGLEHVAEVHEDSLGADFLVSTTPLTDEPGLHSGSVHVARDITRQKQMEKALRESQKDLNRAQAVAQTGNWRLDVRQNQLMWSDETYRIFGIPRGTPLTYEGFLAAVHPDDRDYVDRRWTAALQGEPYDIEHRIVVGTEVKWVRERAEMEFDPQGGLLGGFGIVRDITRRRQAEEALREAHERTIGLARFPEENPNPVMRVSADGCILYCNPAAAKLPAWTCKVGQAPADWLMPLVSQAMAKGEEVQHDVEVGGRAYFVWIVGFPGESYANIYGRDITERKQAEEKLRQRTEELQQLNETLEERVRERTAELATLSSELLVAQERERRRVSQDLHDKIWQALELIKLDIEGLLSKQHATDSPAFREKSKRIITAILETVAKIRSMQGDLWPSVLDDIGILATINWYSREFEKNHSGITIERHVGLEENDVPTPIKIVIYRVMQEAMNNVAEHGHASRVSLSLMKSDQRLEFTVQDNGIGFDPEEIIVKRSPWGGLGLLSMKERTELSGGHFKVDSVRSRGTTVCASWVLSGNNAIVA